MTFGFHPEADAEFEEAVAFYEDRAEDLRCQRLNRVP